MEGWRYHVQNNDVLQDIRPFFVKLHPSLPQYRQVSGRNLVSKYSSKSYEIINEVIQEE